MILYVDLNTQRKFDGANGKVTTLTSLLGSSFITPSLLYDFTLYQYTVSNERFLSVQLVPVTLLDQLTMYVQIEGTTPVERSIAYRVAPTLSQEIVAEVLYTATAVSPVGALASVYTEVEFDTSDSPTALYATT
jgi:hypothetical protein